MCVVGLEKLQLVLQMKTLTNLNSWDRKLLPIFSYVPAELLE